MKRLITVFASLLFCPGFLAAAEPDYKLDKISRAPDGLSKPIADALNPVGIRVIGPDGPVCEVWLVKDLAVKAGFTPTLSVLYPFTPGELIGVLRVPKKSEFSDFREQELPAGVYTLRYDQQPEDGNHIGTSDLADFLLGLSAKDDTDPKPITDTEELSEKSGSTIDSTHPAIFSLLPPEKPPKNPTLTHDEDNDYWIVSLSTNGKESDKTVTVTLRLVVIGYAEE